MHRRKKKRMIIVALAAVLVLAMGSMITGVGSKTILEGVVGESNGR